MAQAKVWKNVKVAMQSAIASAVVITGVTNASSAVASTATPPTAGSFVLLNMPGISQLDGRVVRVGAVVSGTSFVLDGIDSTLFDAFAGVASYQAITLGVSITSATTVTASGGDFPFIDTTTIHDNVRSQIPGLPNAATYTLEHIEDATDAGQQALLQANDVQGQRVFKFTFQNGSFFVFNAYVGFSGLPTGQAQALVTTPSVLTVNKRIVKYAS